MVQEGIDRKCQIKQSGPTRGSKTSIFGRPASFCRPRSGQGIGQIDQTVALISLGGECGWRG